MKSILLLLSIISSLSLLSQNNIGRITGYDFYDLFEFSQIKKYNKDEYFKENKIASMTVIRHSNKSTSNRKYEYNRDGKPVKEVYTSNKGNIYTKEYVYDENGNTLSILNKNNEFIVTSSVNFTYDNLNRLIKWENISKKGTEFKIFKYDQKDNRVYEYIEDNKSKLRKKQYDESGKNIIVNELYKKDTLNPFKKLLYFYYDNGSKKSIEYYEKEKLVYTWNFDCVEEGTILPSKKSENSLICIKTESDNNGNEIKWYHEFHADGYPIKIKYVTDSTGFIKSKTYYSSNDCISMSTTFFKDGGYLNLIYDKKGSLAYVSETIYNANGKIVKQIDENISKPKLNSRVWFSYENNLLILRTQTNKRGTIIEEYQYSFFD